MPTPATRSAISNPTARENCGWTTGRCSCPNDRYPLERFSFRLYYTSRSDDQQTIDVYIEDNMGQVVQKSFTFQNDSDTAAKSNSLKRTSLPGQSRAFLI